MSAFLLDFKFEQMDLFGLHYQIVYLIKVFAEHLKHFRLKDAIHCVQNFRRNALLLPIFQILGVISRLSLAAHVLRNLTLKNLAFVICFQQSYYKMCAIWLWTTGVERWWWTWTLRSILIDRHTKQAQRDQRHVCSMCVCCDSINACCIFLFCVLLVFISQCVKHTHMM